jgi:hypothetical protein
VLALQGARADIGGWPAAVQATIHNGLRFAPPLAELQLALAILRPGVVLLIKGAGRHF